MNDHSAIPSKRLFSQALLIALGRVGGVIAGFAALMMVARLLGPAEMAGVSVAISLAMILSVFCTLNIEAGGVRYLITYLKAQNFRAARGYIRFARRFSMAATLVCFFGAVLVLALIKTSDGVLYLAVIAAPILGFIRVNSGIAMGFSSPLIAVIPRTFIRPVVFCLLIYICYSLSFAPQNATDVIFLFTISCAFVAVIQGLCCRVLTQQIPAVATTDHSAHKQWVYTGGILGLNVIYLEYGAAIAILSASFALPAKEIAYFDIALKIIGLIRFGQVAINQALMPSLSHAIATQNKGEIERLMGLSARLRVLAFVIGTLIIVTLNKPILSAFGSEFTQAAPIVWILLAEIASIALFGPAANVVSFSKRPSVLTKSFVITTAVLVLGTLSFSHLWGLTGAALGYVYARIVWDLTLLRAAHRLTGIDASLSILWPMRRQIRPVA